ncbi:HNH endonuclease signature motif containing protein [Nocardioides halotolerans]|uniref:HNH endonuclease signature motif containing protein n=1 Tax=Nocardioides halotolerans TaxID=433660 RepID=UPI0003F8EC31|nr:HNH endonuclease signature motif containing protein [Nocardioides halotolerans]
MLIEVQRSGSPVVVDDVADEFMLQLVEDAELKAREADRSKLRLATAWAERHVVDDETRAAHWSDADRRDVCEPIGGEGTPLVHAKAVAPLAAALTTSARGAMQLMSDGLDLKHRLPKTHRAMEELRLAPWRAKQIAQLTHRLSREAAAYVDANVAPIADSVGRTRIERLVNEAAARFDAGEQAAEEDAAKAEWDVRFETYSGPVWAGTSRLEAVGDTPTLKKLYDAICKQAHARLDPAVPADEQPSLEHRKVAALGDLADGAGATSKTKLYLHLSPTDEVGTLERFGPVTAPTIQSWLATSRFTLQPVLDLARTDAVDCYEPPLWMRELVILRDRTCVHPNCDRDARECDLDHIEAFVEVDDGGPPGQTRPDNLAPLCQAPPFEARKLAPPCEHRAKTHYGWTYRRNADGSYTWTDPFGRTYDVSV